MTDLLLGLLVGFIVGSPLWAAVAWAALRRKPKWPRFDHDMRGLIPLSGASDAYFKHDYSDTRSLP